MGVEGRILDHLFDVGVIAKKEVEEFLYLPESRKELDFLDQICENWDFE